MKRRNFGAPSCEHGRWTFAGADFKRRRTKWRCPSGECSPASVSIKADRLHHPLVARETKRWRSLHRGRAALDREFGRLKNECGLTPLRVSGLERAAVHADVRMRAAQSGACASGRSTARGVVATRQTTPRAANGRRAYGRATRP